jgi:hypothetical protein
MRLLVTQQSVGAGDFAAVVDSGNYSIDWKRRDRRIECRDRTVDPNEATVDLRYDWRTRGRLRQTDELKSGSNNFTAAVEAADRDTVADRGWHVKGRDRAVLRNVEERTCAIRIRSDKRTAGGNTVDSCAGRAGQFNGGNVEC